MDNYIKIYNYREMSDITRNDSYIEKPFINTYSVICLNPTMNIICWTFIFWNIVEKMNF